MRFRLAAVLLFATLLLALAPPASAQCAMCANAAAAQQAEARKALNLGIAALVAPVFLLIGGFVVLSYRRRNAPDDPTGAILEWSDPIEKQGTPPRLPLDRSPIRPQPFV